MAVETERGVTQEPFVRHYRGATRSDVEAAYRNEAVQAAEAGYLPVTRQWTTDWQGFLLLAVTYRLSVVATHPVRQTPGVPLTQSQASTAVAPPVAARDVTPKPVLDEFALSQPTTGDAPYAGFAPRDDMTTTSPPSQPTAGQPVDEYAPPTASMEPMEPMATLAEPLASQADVSELPTTQAQPADDPWLLQIDQPTFQEPTYQAPEAIQAPEPAAYQPELDYEPQRASEEPATQEPPSSYQQPAYEAPAPEPELDSQPEPVFQAEPEPVQPPEPVSQAEPAYERPVAAQTEPGQPPEPVSQAEPPYEEPVAQQPAPVAQPQPTYETYEQVATAPPVSAPAELPDAPVEPMPAEPEPETPARVSDDRAPAQARQTRLTVQTMDLHSGGEPLRIIRSGFPDVPNLPALERRRWVMQNADHIRRAIIQEPRGHRDMYGAILLPPNSDYADMTVLFMHNEGYSTMCGHGIIAITTGLIEEGLFPATEPVTTIRYEVPAGIVAANAATVQLENGDWAVQGVRFTNVPSYLAAQSLPYAPTEWNSTAPPPSTAR